MDIKPKPTFRDSRDIASIFDSHDPRGQTFHEARITIDLRDIEFINPAAVLWCATYLNLALQKGTECTLLVPQNMGVAAYLSAIGFFDVLKQNGVSVDDRGVHGGGDERTVMPLTRFDTTAEVETLVNRAFDRLHNSGLGSAALHPVVVEDFAELAMNAVQHGQSSIGAFGMIQFFEFRVGPRFVCCVSDGGIGVRSSLERNPANHGKIPYDWVALEYATRERVSGTLDPHRGIGLYGVSEDMRVPGRNLVLHSGIGSLRVDEQVQTQAVRTRLFPGTLAYLGLQS